jgi:hypothetical protein
MPIDQRHRVVAGPRFDRTAAELLEFCRQQI